MGVIRNAANQQINGKVGAVTYYVSEGRQIARQALNNSNYGNTASRSESQQSQRVKWANLVNFYKVCKNWMPKAFENRKRGQSDYNRLMSVNMPFSKIYLTKELANAGACVVDSYIISQGSLPTVELTQNAGAWQSNIYLGDLVPDATTTVAQFSKALVDNNTNMEYGMQVAFVSLMQSVDSLGVPRVICTFYEVTLKQTSTDLVYDYLPQLCCISLNGCLGTTNEIPTGAFAYVVSDLRKGHLEVSTQVLVSTNATMVERYSSDLAKQYAILSYGLDPGVVLSPLTENEQGQTPSPVYIQFIQNGENVYEPGDVTPDWENMPNDFIVTFNLIGVTPKIDYVTFTAGGDTNVMGWQPYQQSTGVIRVSRTAPFIDSALLERVSVHLTTGVVISADFNVDAE